MSEHVYSPYAQPRGGIAARAQYQSLFGFKSQGPHASLVKQLVGPVVCTCPTCGGTGLNGTYGDLGWRACPTCHRLGSAYTVSLEELEALRQQVLAQYPDSGAPDWRPFVPFRVPGLRLDTDLIIELDTEPQAEQMELPLG